MEAAFKDDEEAQVVRVVQVELLKEESAEQETFCYNTVPLILYTFSAFKHGVYTGLAQVLTTPGKTLCLVQRLPYHLKAFRNGTLMRCSSC